MDPIIRSSVDENIPKMVDTKPRLGHEWQVAKKKVKKKNPSKLFSRRKKNKRVQEKIEEKPKEDPLQMMTTTPKTNLSPLEKILIYPKSYPGAHTQLRVEDLLELDRRKIKIQPKTRQATLRPRYKPYTGKSESKNSVSPSSPEVILPDGIQPDKDRDKTPSVTVGLSLIHI